MIIQLNSDPADPVPGTVIFIFKQPIYRSCSYSMSVSGRRPGSRNLPHSRIDGLGLSRLLDAIAGLVRTSGLLHAGGKQRTRFVIIGQHILAGAVAILHITDQATTHHQENQPWESEIPVETEPVQPPAAGQTILAVPTALHRAKNQGQGICHPLHQKK